MRDERLVDQAGWMLLRSRCHCLTIDVECITESRHGRHTERAHPPPRVAQKLAELAASSMESTRTDAVVHALDDYLNRQAGGSDAYALAADLIPKRGVAKLQSATVRKLAHDAFRGSRAR